MPRIGSRDATGVAATDADSVNDDGAVEAYTRLKALRETNCDVGGQVPSQQQRADASCSESGSSIASTAAEEVRAEFDVRSFLACSPSRDGRPELALLQLRGHFAEFLREQSAFQEAALRRTAMSDDSSADDLDADLAAALNDPGICGKHYKIGTHSAKVGGPLAKRKLAAARPAARQSTACMPAATTSTVAGGGLIGGSGRNGSSSGGGGGGSSGSGSSSSSGGGGGGGGGSINALGSTSGSSQRGPEGDLEQARRELATAKEELRLMRRALASAQPRGAKRKIKMRVDIPPGMKPGQTLRVTTPAGWMTAIIPEGSEAFGHFVLMVPASAPAAPPGKTRAT